MNLAVIQNSTYQDFSFTNLFDLIIDFKDYHPEVHNLQHHEDEIPKFEWALSELSKKAAEIDAIVLSNLLEDDSEDILSDEIGYCSSAFDFALHLRFHHNEDVRFLPIVILSFKTLENLLVKSVNLPQIIGTDGVFIVNPNSLTIQHVNTWVEPPKDEIFDETNFIEPALKTIDLIIGDCNKEQVKLKYADIIKRLIIKNHATSGHDVANEWGAYRMAEVAGLIDITRFSYPKTLYFKYLLRNVSSINVNEDAMLKCEPFFEGNLNILFIDDNYNKGWENCLKGVFEERIIRKGKVTITSRPDWDDSLLSEIETDKFYDLILLDYYLPNNIKGINKLKKIKNANAVIPVIMFTASNKAWSMDELYQAGGDGYYVKEHPETAHDPEFSVKNFENFYCTIKQCLEKGVLLRPYWKRIKEIREEFGKSTSLVKEKCIKEKMSKFRERIEERLLMFLGFLKKSQEQSKFNESTFYYEELETAFLTLWSILNEVSECYFVKTQPVTPYFNKNGTEYKCHPDGEVITYRNTYSVQHFKWVIEGNTFLSYDYTSKLSENGEIKQLKGFFQSDYKQKSDFELKDGSFKFTSSFTPKVEYDKAIQMQIAYILIVKFKTGMNNSDPYIKVLNNSNKVRNHLYLTHGEGGNSDVYTETVRQLRKKGISKVTKQKIDDLFKLVYFLTTESKIVKI